MLGEDDWRAGFELTVMSAVTAIRAAVPRMIAGGYGRIIVLGSSSARMPIPNLALSNAFRPVLVSSRLLPLNSHPRGLRSTWCAPDEWTPIVSAVWTRIARDGRG